MVRRSGTEDRNGDQSNNQTSDHTTGKTMHVGSHEFEDLMGRRSIRPAVVTPNPLHLRWQHWWQRH